MLTLQIKINTLDEFNNNLAAIANNYSGSDEHKELIENFIFDNISKILYDINIKPQNMNKLLAALSLTHKCSINIILDMFEMIANQITDIFIDDNFNKQPGPNIIYTKLNKKFVATELMYMKYI